MRLISVDGKIDIPYDMCMLFIYHGRIIASPLTVGEHTVMAEYSNDDVAKDILKDIRGVNALGRIAYTIPKPEGVKE